MQKPAAAPDDATDEVVRPKLPDHVRMRLLEQEVSALHTASTKLVLGQEHLGAKIDLIREDILKRERQASERVEQLCGHISRGVDAGRKVMSDFKPGVYLIILAAVARLLAGVVETLDIDGWGTVDFVDKTDIPHDTKSRPRSREAKAADSDPPVQTDPEPTP